MYSDKITTLRAKYQINSARLLRIESEIKTAVGSERTKLVSEQLEMLLSQLQVSEDLVNELRHHQQLKDAKFIES